MNSSLDIKIAIIGAGPTGINLSSSLVRKGFQVALIEAGRADSEGNDLSLESYLFESASSIPENVHRLGGGSNYWVGRIGEFLPLDFDELRGVRPQSFPLDYEDIKEFYGQAFELLTGNRIHDSELVLSESARLNIELPKNLALRIIRYANKSYFRDSLDNLDRNPKFKLHLGQKCTEISKTFDSGGKELYKIVCSPGETELSGTFDVVILCCGAMQSPTLVLNSPDLLNSENSMIAGSFLMEHFEGFAGEIIWNSSKHSKLLKKIKLDHNRETRKSEGLGLGIKISEMLRSQNASLNLQLEVIPRQRKYIFDPAIRNEWLPMFNFLYFIERILRKALAEIANTIMGIFGKATYSVWVKSEILPNSDSKISLFKEGQKTKTRYHHIVSQKSKLEFIRALKILEEELSHARVGDLKIKPAILNGTDQILQGRNWHPMGTLRMGLDPAHSVCDSDLRLRSAERIYVADASVFPSGSNANPTFTALALGLRLASYLDDQHKKSAG